MNTTAILFLETEESGQLPFLTMILLMGVFLVRFCFDVNKLTQNALHKTLVRLFVNELHVILKSHEILIWFDIITLTLKNGKQNITV